MENKMVKMGRTAGQSSSADATEFWARNERELRSEQAANSRLRAKLVAKHGATTADAILAAKAKVERWER
jgi:hypothetical protein